MGLIPKPESKEANGKIFEVDPLNESLEDVKILPNGEILIVTNKAVYTTVV